MYFKFRNPKKVDIVILDNECDSLLLDYIIKNELNKPYTYPEHPKGMSSVKTFFFSFNFSCKIQAVEGNK